MQLYLLESINIVNLKEKLETCRIRVCLWLLINAFNMDFLEHEKNIPCE